LVAEDTTFVRSRESTDYVNMHCLQLIHWNIVEAKEKAQGLQAAGYAVHYEVPNGPPFLRKLRENPPIAIVIDLTRLPSQGRDIALALRQYKTTRNVPLVFVDGDAEKVSRIKELLPDAVFTTWSRIRSPLKQAIAHPPLEPVVTMSAFDAYAGTPLARKLGIKPNSVVALMNAPRGFENKLDKLPEGATIQRKVNGKCSLTIWFTVSIKDLKENINRMVRLVDRGSVWIVWPKKSVHPESDLTQQRVREFGLKAGLVDYKICAIDETWSGLLFTKRKSK
jgi:CheY-like chemotaxis protein